MSFDVLDRFWCSFTGASNGEEGANGSLAAEVTSKGVWRRAWVDTRLCAQRQLLDPSGRDYQATRRMQAAAPARQ